MRTLILSIAGYNIFVRTEAGYEPGLENSWLPFQIKCSSVVYDILIDVKVDDPVHYISHEKPVFEASDQMQKFYAVYEVKDQYKIIAYQPFEKNTIQQVAFIDRNFSKWQIITNRVDKNGFVYPFLYPLGPLIFYYMTVKFPLLMIHASGVHDFFKGRLFSGFSGTGKSTMAEIWQQQGFTIINDDRLLIKKEQDEFFIFNTPMIYPDVPKKSPLHSIFLIEHSKENNIRKLSGSESMTGVMAFCIQQHFNKDFINQHMEFILQLIQKVGVYRLGFVPDQKVIDFIKTHEL